MEKPSITYFSTHEVAKTAGIHRDTLLRWLREKRIPEPNRDRNDWRIFTPKEMNHIVDFSNNVVRESAPAYGPSLNTARVQKLESIDWNFTNAKTGYLTHSVHPYPAKFIPQIPRTLIRELASTGDTILDPFCGSGTTLVEAIRLECNAVGVDANPLACLISRAKTTRIDEFGASILSALVEEVTTVAQSVTQADTPLFKSNPLPLEDDITSLAFEGVEDWFDLVAIKELAFIKKKCIQIERSALRDISLAAFSSIIVTASRQDSDTRYVRREKNIKPGDCLRMFIRSLKEFIKKGLELGEEVISTNTVQIFEANILQPPAIPKVDLVVCSPPYPNAYSYHLYHRTRMLWLGMDQPRFKKEEIGSHRKYSNKGKNGATVETFRDELNTILMWLHTVVKERGYVCFVIGDSILNGQKIENDQLFIDVARNCGFSVEANINRTLQDTKKSFNPKIGKIRDEHIVILSNNSNEKLLLQA